MVYWDVFEQRKVDQRPQKICTTGENISAWVQISRRVLGEHYTWNGVSKKWRVMRVEIVYYRVIALWSFIIYGFRNCISTHPSCLTKLWLWNLAWSFTLFAIIVHLQEQCKCCLYECVVNQSEIDNEKESRSKTKYFPHFYENQPDLWTECR